MGSNIYIYYVLCYFPPWKLCGCVCVWGVAGACCAQGGALALQFHTCLIFSEFGEKGFVEECVSCGLDVRRRGNESGGGGGYRKAGGAGWSCLTN